MDGSGVLGIVDDLTRQTGMPADVVNRHVSKLQASVGLQSGAVLELTPRNLQEAASMSTKPREFVDKYKAAAAQSTQNLAPMVEVLHGICLDSETRAHFSSAAGRDRSGISIGGGGLTDFQALKEKLLQQVGPRAVPDSGGGPGMPGGAGGRHQRPFPDRPHLTLDFLDEEHQIRANVGELGKIPVASQESAIIEDLLYCFVGRTGFEAPCLTSVLSLPCLFSQA